MLEDEPRRELEAEDFGAEEFTAGAAGLEDRAPGKPSALLGAGLEFVAGVGLDPGLPVIAATLAAACLH